MASHHYFDFLANVWSQLPNEDRDRLAELWYGYEQVFAAVYQKFAEVKLNNAVQDLQPFATERWLPYEFTAANSVLRPATLTSTQDLSVGVNLGTRYLIRFSIDGGQPLEVDLRGPNLFTSIAEIVAKFNLTAGFPLARAIFDNTIVQLASTSFGPASSIEILPTTIPAANACEYILGIDPLTLPRKFPEYPYAYRMPYEKVVEIPTMQDAIRDESVTETLQTEIDYAVEARSIIAFKTMPPTKLWARRSQVDKETPWNNFGFLMDIYQENSQRYVDILQGLWFAFWSGPKPMNVKKSLYLLFGLPSARAAGMVAALTPTTITVTYTAGESQVFEIPTGLTAIVAVGDSVEKFSPLVSGIDVFDKTNYPGFITEEVGRSGIQRYLTENASLGFGDDSDETKALTLLEENIFVPQFSVDTFISPDINLGNVKLFLDAIKPLSKTYLFQVIIGRFTEPLGLKEKNTYHGHIRVDSSFDLNETTLLPPADLLLYETEENPGLDLDPHGILLGERTDIEVTSFGSLIDSFSI